MKNLLLFLFIIMMMAMQIKSQNLVNGNFELGPNTGWIKYTKSGYELIGTANLFQSSSITPAVVPRSGLYMARIGGFSYEENSLKQTVTLPVSQKVYLGMYYQDRASTTTECSGLWVGTRIRVFVYGQLLLDQYQCYYNTVNQWTFVYFDLSAAAGRQVEIEFRADAANTAWSFLYLDDISILTSLTDIKENASLISEYSLGQNYPNPFNPETIISYQLPISGNTSLKVFDILGREVAILVNNEMAAGKYEIKLDCSKLSSGIYFYQLRAGDFVETKKLVLMK